MFVKVHCQRRAAVCSPATRKHLTLMDMAQCNISIGLSQDFLRDIIQSADGIIMAADVAACHSKMGGQNPRTPVADTFHMAVQGIEIGGHPVAGDRIAADFRKPARRSIWNCGYMPQDMPVPDYVHDLSCQIRRSVGIPRKRTDDPDIKMRPEPRIRLKP